MRGHFCLVLHAHLPFVRSPEHEDFLEEDWLYEALTECYLPLLRAFERLSADDVPFRVALTLTPTLVSMLRDDLLMRRYSRRLDRLVDLAGREVRRTRGDAVYAALAAFYRERFTQVRADFHDRYLGDVVGAFRRLQEDGHVEIMASAATHAFLPALTVNPEAIRAQIATGIASHRATFDRPPSGFWLPECGYFPGVETPLAREGIRFTVVESHAVTDATPRPRYGVFAPLATESGVAAFGRDPESSLQVWSAEHGYPGDPDYREFYRDIGYDLPVEDIRPFLLPTGGRRHTGIKYHRVTGRTPKKAPYDRDAALARARQHAKAFVASREAQFARLAQLMGPRRPVVVAPFDAELFGHWWFEGPEFLEAFVREAARSEAFELVSPSDHLEAESRVQVAAMPLSSWGEGGYASVWVDDSNTWIYPDLYEAERSMARLATEAGRETDPVRVRALNQATRELMLAEASDWAFILKARTATTYAARRVREHLAGFRCLRDGLRAGRIDPKELVRLEQRDNLFPDIDYRVYTPATTRRG